MLIFDINLLLQPYLAMLLVNLPMSKIFSKIKFIFLTGLSLAWSEDLGR